jgi:hypothetical protein
MKKLFATLLALSLVLCFALTANAAMIGEPNGVENLDSSNNTASNNVTITLKDTTTGGSTQTLTVYMVDVVWKSPALVYTLSGSGDNNTIVWDPIDHKYELSAGEGSTIDGSWTTQSFNIFVTNHSNDEIKADLTLPEPKNGVTLTADKLSLTLDRADIGDSLNNKTKAPTDKFIVSAKEGSTPNGSFSVETTVTITPAP